MPNPSVPRFASAVTQIGRYTRNCASSTGRRCGSKCARHRHATVVSPVARACNHPLCTHARHAFVRIVDACKRRPPQCAQQQERYRSRSFRLRGSTAAPTRTIISREQPRQREHQVARIHQQLAQLRCGANAAPTPTAALLVHVDKARSRQLLQPAPATTHAATRTVAVTAYRSSVPNVECNALVADLQYARGLVVL